MTLIRVDSIPSTNSLMKDLAAQQALPEGTVVLTREQSAGRGQVGTSWESEPGKNLTFSLLLYPDFLPIHSYFLLSEAVALGIKEALSVYLDSLAVKWPNDLYHKNRKLAGILIENELQGQTIARSVIGIGINVNQETFRSDAVNPISMKQITGVDYDLGELLERIISSVFFYYNELKDGRTESVIQSYHQSLYRREGYHPYQDKEGEFFARIDRVDNSGFLHLTTQGGEQRKYAFKSVRSL